MHVMQACFKPKCFAFLDGDKQALDKEPMRGLYWQGEHVSYYSQALLMGSSLSEEETISKTLNTHASTMTRMEGISKWANSWDHLTHYGDVPKQQEILTYTDVLVPSRRRTVVCNPRPIAAAQ